MDARSLIDVAAGRAPADLVLKGGHVVDVFGHGVGQADVAILGDLIAGIGSYEGRQTVDVSGAYLLPGLIDAHVHVESSLLSVPEFARAVAPHGTSAAVTDPHEIANVLGVDGIRYMLHSAVGCPIDVFVMLSSCVPASPFESAGATLEARDLLPLFSEPGVIGLAEVMNYPAVCAAGESMLAKIAAAGDRVIDGHAPGLGGKALSAYVAAGIQSDHECTTAGEAREKVRAGLMIMIREGSQARNLDALLPAVTPENAHRFCFCTDDKLVDDLLAEGQIDHILRRAVASGLDPLLAVRMATWNPATHFRLRRHGALAPGCFADIAIVDDLRRFNVRRVYHRGRLVAEDGKCVMPANAALARPRPAMNAAPLRADLFRVPVATGAVATIIEVVDGSLVTGRASEPAPQRDGVLAADPARDLAKIAVIERHHATGRCGVALVRGFGLQRGALASTVAHDAHNLVVVGMSDEDMFAAAQHLLQIGGGLCAVDAGRVLADLPLPIAGLLTDLPAHAAAAAFGKLRAAAADLGSRMSSPFMALSFLTLSVIGSLKLSDQGLIDVDAFRKIDLIS